MPILELLKSNKFTVKDSVRFGEETVDQQTDISMGSLDVDSLFINIPLEESIEVFSNEIFK